MFRYNPAANYQPNGGQYLQILSGKDLYKRTIVVSAMENDGVPLTFLTRFPNIFVDYPLWQMCVGDKLWKNWNKAPMRLWQTWLNFAVWCTSSACWVSSAHLNYTKHPMIRLVYRFHVYYHVRRILKRLQVPLPHETSFNVADNPYTWSEFFKICEDYRVSNGLWTMELWTLTKTLENTIDSFHRRLLRKVIHVKWPRTVSNKDLYEWTHMIPWSKTINRRRLTWFGHLLRLPSDTPAREALRIMQHLLRNPQENQRPPGWVQFSVTLNATVIYKLLETLEKTWKDLNLSALTERNGPE